MSTNANQVFYNRRSPREFKSTSIKKEDLDMLFEAAHWAASSFNEQPWLFLYGTKSNQDTYQKLFSCLSAGNQGWAKEAPVLMMTFTKTFFSKNNSPNRHAFHDLGLAMGNFSIQASMLDIMIHQMAGFDREKAMKLFDLPEGYEPVTMVAIGYSDEQKSNRTRKPLNEFVFADDLSLRDYISK